MKLKNRVALVTGSGSGLGRAIAVMLAKEGAKIGVNDICESGMKGTVEILRGAGAETLALPADVTKVNQVQEMFEKLEDAWGTIDILVNNAGLSLPSMWPGLIKLTNEKMLKAAGEFQTSGKMMESMKITSAYEDDWWLGIIDVSLNGTFYCTREALKIMESKRTGKIINVSSIYGISGGAGSPAYAAAKGAIVTFTQSIAREVIASNIYVNAVAPGFIDTPLLDNIDDVLKLGICAMTPLGRMATPEEIASTVAYLASDDANFFVGQIISPNGGLQI